MEEERVMIPEIISFGKTELTLEEFVEPQNDWIKPIGGIWGSTYLKDQEISSDWERWCIAENYEYNREEAVIFTLRRDAKVYEIDSVEDLNILARAYNVHENHKPLVLDFEAMVAAGIDAIHLTEKGQAETRFSRPYSLYGWDVECYLILNFDAIDLQKPAIRKDMHWLIEKFENANTATSITEAMESFRVFVGGRGAGKMAAMLKELQEMARLGEEDHQREEMQIISSDGLDSVRQAMERFAASVNELNKFGIEPLPDPVEELGPSPTEIKRRLKYAKNPMEIKQLNQQLTRAYKIYGKGGGKHGLERR